MSAGPRVSVVMGVYNAGGRLPDTLASILAQADVELELIAVDDGSTDGSAEVLEVHASRDPRVRVLRQPRNLGLTRALVRGCAAARGEFIARHDTGDRCRPDWLATLLGHAESTPGAAIVSCGTRFIGPEGEILHDLVLDPADARARLLTLDPARIRGPAHGGTIFPRALYERVGGYRPAFYFAQDLDLWVRLAELGEHVVEPRILYESSITPGSISGRYRREQIATKRLIIECARRRRAGLPEEPVLRRAEAIRPDGRRSTRLDRARALYFIGMCLRVRGSAEADGYFREALRAFPLHLKSAVRLLAPGRPAP